MFLQIMFTLIQTVILKIFQGIIYPQALYAFRNLFMEKQHGILPGRSIDTNLYTNMEFSFSCLHDCFDVQEFGYSSNDRIAMWI